MAVDTPALINAVTLQDRHYRQLLRAALGGTPEQFAGGIGDDNDGAHGVLGVDHLEVTQSSTPGMTVTVSAGVAAITGTESAGQGPFPFYNDAPEVLSVATAHSTQARKDLVIAVTGTATPSLVVVTGTPHTSNPVDPSLAGYPNALVLARVNVAASASSITNGNIDDLRTFAGIASRVSKSGDSMSGNLLVGKDATNIVIPGLELNTNGTMYTACSTSQAGLPNLYTQRGGDANVNGEPHIEFHHGGASTLAGSVTRNGATGVNYNTSSDARLKDLIGDIDPEVAGLVLRLVRPAWFRWLADGDDGPIMSGYVAQQVAEAWPDAITHGLVTPGWARPDGTEVPWQMDMAKMTPVLHAGWLWLDERLTAIEARLA